MKPLTFPVSRLTAAIMRNQYGSDNIRLDRADIRKRELKHVGSSNKHLERKQYALNSSITLLLNKHDYDHAAGRTAEIGYYFYALDKVNLFRFVWARVTAGRPALHAIYDFYELHGIEEDDFPIETAEREWKRWRKEKEKERLYFAPQIVPQNTTVLLSEKQAANVVRRLTSFIKEGCIDMDPRFMKAVVAWVYCDLSPLTQNEVANKTNTMQQSVSRSLIRFRSYLAYNEELQKHIAYCLKTTKARPTPSAAS